MRLANAFFIMLLFFLCSIVHADDLMDKYSGLKPEKLLKKGIQVCDSEDFINNADSIRNCRYILSSGGYDGSHAYVDLANTDFQNDISYFLVNLPKKSSYVSKNKINCSTHQIAVIASWKFEGYFQTGKLLEANNSTGELYYISADPGSLFENSLSLYCFFKEYFLRK